MTGEKAMEWWLIALGLIAVVAFGIFATVRRNRDPEQKELFDLLCIAVSVPDDPQVRSSESQRFEFRVRDLIARDGTLATGRRLAHLASMARHYPGLDPASRTKAELLIRKAIDDIA